MTILYCIISFLIGGIFGVFLTALAVAYRRGDDLATRIHTCASHCGYCYLAHPKDGDPDADR